MLLVSGSFVTAKQDPNDVDRVALSGQSHDDDSKEASLLEEGLPFIELKVPNEEETCVIAIMVAKALSR